jgi:glycosyltransferase involved in cell wall biosynthesis
MKIAVLSSIAWRTPPKKYGPWEQVASNVAEGLVDKGHQVTLFATGDSFTKGKLSFAVEKPYNENPDADVKVQECLHISNLMEQADRFDIIHNHFDFLPLTYSKLIKTPMLTTIHGFSSPKIIPVYQKYNDSNYYVSISNSDRNKALTYISTVYNGINTDDFNFNPTPEDYLLFFGRIHPDKGTAEAVKIAKKSGKTLIISGLIQDQQYFDSQIKPFINDKDVIYAGNSGSIQRNTLLGGARALLHPVKFEEPFGLSVAEAAFCGTPVIAFNRGSMPELIMDGKTGFLVQTLDEACEVLEKIPEINRFDCRAHALALFTKEKMTESYIRIYQKIILHTQSIHF